MVQPGEALEHVAREPGSTNHHGPGILGGAKLGSQVGCVCRQYWSGGENQEMWEAGGQALSRRSDRRPQSARYSDQTRQGPNQGDLLTPKEICVVHPYLYLKGNHLQLEHPRRVPNTRIQGWRVALNQRPEFYDFLTQFGNRSP